MILYIFLYSVIYHFYLSNSELSLQIHNILCKRKCNVKMSWISAFVNPEFVKHCQHIYYGFVIYQDNKIAGVAGNLKRCSGKTVVDEVILFVLVLRVR